MFEGFGHHRIEVDGVEINLRTGGSGPPLLLVHGYPQTHVAWHRVAPILSEHFTLVIPDLRGCGDSGKPPGDATHLAYSKRVLAADQVQVMRALGYPRFRVAGHDRGGRVVHRLCLDHPDRIEQAAVLDIVPTRHAYRTVDKVMAATYFHWFFLIQPYDLPERLIGAESDLWLDRLMNVGAEDDFFDVEAIAEYRRCFRDPKTIHATCEDYRAAAGIDLDHDAADLDRRIGCPLLVLWGERSFVGRHYDPLGTWREVAADVRGCALPSGHFPAEEAPGRTAEALLNFFEP
ncbi:alpha/beta fold hydrolase [Nocardia sp. R7R-8]|uniref:alpha/beta fold hydrolase n=1 Tax=Nocardia sp. R7R-8 TaxID=3459304 RepID=UPI00403D75BD